MDSCTTTASNNQYADRRAIFGKHFPISKICHLVNLDLHYLHSWLSWLSWPVLAVLAKLVIISLFLSFSCFFSIDRILSQKPSVPFCNNGA